MTFVWLTPVIILVLFSTVIIYQGRIEQKATLFDEDQQLTGVDQDEHEQMNA